MRNYAVLAASAHLLLAACQTAPGGLLPPPPPEMTAAPATAPPAPATAPPQQAAGAQPYMRCVSDFWGNCTGVVSSRHAYRWRYVRPGMRPAEERESPVVRASLAAARESAPPPSKAGAAATAKKAAPATPSAPAAPAAREPSPILEVAMTMPAMKSATPPAPEKRPAAAATPAPEKRPAAARNTREPPPVREAAARDTTLACHSRRRVIGEERASNDDALRAAENGWMGAVRYDHGERYQDINRAKDVRHICGPSSVSAALRVPHFRCVVEATPCRETKGTPAEPDERRYDRGGEAQISRR